MRESSPGMYLHHRVPRTILTYAVLVARVRPNYGGVLPSATSHVLRICLNSASRCRLRHAGGA